MPDLNDFHAFTSTSGDSGGGGSSGGMGCLTWAIIIYVFLTILGKLS